MDYLPLHLDLKNRDCLVVGGGALAVRKVELLLRAGAAVQVVAEVARDSVRALATEGSIQLSERRYQPDDVLGRRLVVAATDAAAVNAQVFSDCEAAGVWINTVDAPELCSAIFPAIVDRGPVQVSVSTGGRSPTLARVVRGWLEARLPPRLGAFALYAAKRRDRVRAALPDAVERRRFWDRLSTGAIAERIFSSDEPGTEDAFNQALVAAKQGVSSGLAALVGAGPGDPELITLRGLRLLQQADVVLYDNLVNPQILDYARRDAERIHVGKRRHFTGVRQAGINQLLVAHAEAGACVVRLKGGDPFIFGRGGEEVETLATQGIDLVVVPGITAALGAAGYAGVPLTHRDIAQSVRFVTGHRVDNEVNLDWSELINPHQTLVVYMGLLGLPQIAAKLIAQGMNPKTPALMVENATLPQQREIQAPIRDLPEAVAHADVRGPTVIIIGEVVRHRFAGS